MKKEVCKIGGQAVIEGVMMRGQNAMATAVRNSDGEIVVESERFTPLSKKSKFYSLPIIRGIANFASSMAMGIKIINRSSQVFGEEIQDLEPSKFEKWVSKKFKIDIMKVLIFISMAIGILLAIGLFVILPHLATEGIIRLFKMSPNTIVLNLIAGIIRIIIFITYIVLISRMKDIKRLFMYHGAEHKVISCYESGQELTVENAQKMKTIHDRCGTTFIFIIMIFSIIFFSFDVFSTNLWQRILIRLIFIPFVAGVSYELLKLFARFDNVFTKIFKAPGLWLQKLTTKEPEDEMVEVAIVAFNTVINLEENPDAPTQEFTTYVPLEPALEELMKVARTKNEAELIYMNILGLDKRTELYEQKSISSVTQKKAKEIALRREKGAPLQYILGSAHFYGYDLMVDQRVLIPRFDSEILAKKVIDIANTLEQPQIVDLMTGSGAIAIAVKKNANCIMTATDISKDALEVARINADKNNCDIELLHGSLFAPIKNKKFDVICCNPPYIATGELSELDREVVDFEPIVALDGGADGLDYYRDIAEKAHLFLKEKGFLLLEVGITQAEKVKDLLGDKYLINFEYDLNNPPIARVVVAQLKAIKD